LPPAALSSVNVGFTGPQHTCPLKGIHLFVRSAFPPTVKEDAAKLLKGARQFLHSALPQRSGQPETAGRQEIG